MAVSDEDFKALKNDHNRLRIVTMNLIGLLGVLLEKAGADPADVVEFKKSFPEVTFDPSKLTNAGIRMAKQISESDKA